MLNDFHEGTAGEGTEQPPKAHAQPFHGACGGLGSWAPRLIAPASPFLLVVLCLCS